MLALIAANIMNKNPEQTAPRLSSLAHGGGCGCKIAPAVLQEILAKKTPAFSIFPPQLLVGIETSDDAAVYQLNEQQAIVATTDFFMPMIDDAFDFGRIAATNAISDIYAMGGTPLFALALVGMPVNQLPLETIALILKGGEAVCAQAKIPIAGGHSIDSLEPIYGLVAIGLVNPAQIKRNSGALAGDKLILGKGLGVGIYSSAFKKDLLCAADYVHLIASTTQLNTPGIKLGGLDGVHAMTDVTGFGLLGHLLEICKGSSLSAQLDFARLPLLPNVLDYAQQGCITGASARNLNLCGAFLDDRQKPLNALERALLADPQTSGGLLVACAPEIADQVLAIFAHEGFAQAALIGEMQAMDNETLQIKLV